MSDYNANFENKAPEGSEAPSAQEPVQQNVQDSAPEQPHQESASEQNYGQQASYEHTSRGDASGYSYGQNYQQQNGYSGGDPSRNTGWTSNNSRNNWSQQQNQGGYGYQQQNRGWAPPQQEYCNAYSGYQNPQEPAAENNEPYQWNFEEYDNARAKKRVRKNSGLKIFGALIACVLGLTVLSLAAVGGWYMISNTFVEGSPSEAVSSSIAQSAPPVENPSYSGGLTLTDRPSSSSEAPAAEPEDGTPLSTPDIADKVRPSVVGILNYSNSGTSVQSILTPSEGSGIIMSADGYILTNAHVVSGAVGLKVVMSDGTEYEAKMIGADDLTDIAVIKVEANDLPYAEFGNSDQLRVGERVVAIGNPRGLSLAGSVTQGIVSAVNRTLSGSGDISYIQTDAAINPGNSGGALVNEYGQVIGINTAKIAQAAGSDTIYEGIGFAIPITEAKPIIDDLKAYGRVTGRVRIGVVVQTVDAYTASIYGVPQGAIVVSTEEGSDIAAKGIISGDIIYAVDGVNITSTDDLKTSIIGKKPGDTIVMSVYRATGGQKAKQFDVEVALMEDTGTTIVTP